MAPSLLSTASWEEHFPDILHAVVEHADYATSLRLRGVCRYLCERVHSAFSPHLIWRSDGVYTKLRSGEERRHPLTLSNAVRPPSHATYSIPRNTGPKRLDPAAEKCGPLSAFRFTQVMDVYRHEDLCYLSVLPHDLQISLLRVWTIKWPLASLKFTIDTVVFRGQRPPNATKRYALLMSIPASRLPRRVVVHFDSAALEAYIKTYFRLITDKNSKDHPVNSEVILVAQQHTLWHCNSFGIFEALRRVFLAGGARTFNRYVVVEYTSVVQPLTLIVVAQLFGLRPDFAASAAFGDIVRGVLEAKGDASVASKIQYLSLDEWRAEFGDGRFELEMGD